MSSVKMQDSKLSVQKGERSCAVVSMQPRNEAWERLQAMRVDISSELPSNPTSEEDFKSIVRKMSFNRAFSAWKLLMRNNSTEASYLGDMISVAITNKVTLGEIMDIEESASPRGPTLLKCAKLYHALCLEEEEHKRRSADMAGGLLRVLGGLVGSMARNSQQDATNQQSTTEQQTSH